MQVTECVRDKVSPSHSQNKKRTLMSAKAIIICGAKSLCSFAFWKRCSTQCSLTKVNWMNGDSIDTIETYNEAAIRCWVKTSAMFTALN